MESTTEHTEHTEGGGFGTTEGYVDRRFVALTGVIRQAAFEVHRFFGPGFLENVYRNALCNRLGKKGLNIGDGRFTIRDEDGKVVGTYIADVPVEGKVIVEVKAVSGLRPEHAAQLLNYLKASGIRVGLLINFGRPVMQCKRFVI